MLGLDSSSSYPFSLLSLPSSCPLLPFVAYLSAVAPPFFHPPALPPGLRAYSAARKIRLYHANMAQLDTLDIVVLILLLVGTVAYFTKGKYWAVPKDPYTGSLALANGLNKAGRTRNFLEKMEQTGKNCIIFYGSQTGTAEDYATRMAKEGHSRFGLSTIVADLEEYDFDNLDIFPQDKIAFFVLATYGEGEPTDNAVEFNEFITGDEPAFSEGASADEQPLGKLRYVTFGLGNNTYEHYNSMVRNVDKALTKLGATRIGEAGEGDDGAGTMEEDFLAWKEPMWAALAEAMGLEEREAVYEPTFEITSKADMSADDAVVYLGEPNRSHLEGKTSGPFNANNPYIASIVESRELFTTPERNCLHVEIDISGTNLSYTSGDHVAIWPTNPGKEVDRFFKVLGLADRRHDVISVRGLDPTARVPFPSPTTYDAVIRYHMEICAPVSRQFVAQVAAFAPTDACKEAMTQLGADKDLFHSKVAGLNLNIAQLLELQSGGEPWPAIPFSIFIETLTKLQPRYYSISSSALAQKHRVAVTAVVESLVTPASPHVLKGVTTNYLFALKLRQQGAPDPDPFGLRYALDGPRARYGAAGAGAMRVPVHVRHSNFKLPSDPARPIIMVGPGTGVAPFRGFVMERAERLRAGEKVGKMLLFFGCRRKSEDFLYAEEWEVRLCLCNIRPKS